MAIESADRRIVSAVTLLETGIVMRARHGPQAIQTLSNLLVDAAIEVAFFDHVQANMAIAVFDRYGKGLQSACTLELR